MPKPFPKKFREDVLKVVNIRESGVTITQIAKDFGIHPGTIDGWLRQERVNTGERPGVSTPESDELRDLRKRNRLLEQEVEVLRRAAAYLGQAHLP